MQEPSVSLGVREEKEAPRWVVHHPARRRLQETLNLVTPIIDLPRKTLTIE
jgi:hypothetical protein